ncbi:hypothetical protein Bhyg_12160, partial [Pseudolycoriella hygida]
LIMEVEAHREIYDKSDPNHKLKGKIEEAWREIAFKQKWKNLRDMFRVKHREQMMQVSGAKGGKKRMDFLPKVLFLVPHIETSGTMSNYSPLSSSQFFQPNDEQFDENTDIAGNSIRSMETTKEFTTPASQIL